MVVWRTIIVALAIGVISVSDADVAADATALPSDHPGPPPPPSAIDDDDFDMMSTHGTDMVDPDFDEDNHNETRVKRDATFRMSKESLVYKELRIQSWFSDNFAYERSRLFRPTNIDTMKKIIAEVSAELSDGFMGVRLPHKGEDKLFVDFRTVRHQYRGNYDTETAKNSEVLNGDQRLIPGADLLILWKHTTGESTCRRTQCDDQQGDRCRFLNSPGYLATAGPIQFSRILNNEGVIVYARVTVIGVHLCHEMSFNPSGWATAMHEVVHGMGSLGNRRPDTKKTIHDGWMSGAMNARARAPVRTFETFGHMPNTKAAMADYYNCNMSVIDQAGVLGFEWGDAHPRYRINFAELNKFRVADKYYMNTNSPVMLAYLTDRRWFLQFGRTTTAQIMQQSLPMWKINPNSRLRANSDKRHWFAKDAGCSFIKDSCYEFILKRMKKYMGVRHAPGYPYCTPYEAMKSVFAQAGRTPVKNNGAIPMCANKKPRLVVGHMRCEMLQRGGGWQHWQEQASYSRTIDKWLRSGQHTWAGDASWLKHYSGFAPMEAPSMQGCPVWSPSTDQGMELPGTIGTPYGNLDWTQVEALADAQPCMCDVASGIACDQPYELADPPIDDAFAPKPRDPFRKNRGEHSGMQFRLKPNGQPDYGDDEEDGDNGATCNAIAVYCVMATFVVNFVIRV